MQESLIMSCDKIISFSRTVHRRLASIIAKRDRTFLPPRLTLPFVFLCGSLSFLFVTWVWTDTGNVQWILKSSPSFYDGSEQRTVLGMSKAEQLHQEIRVLCLVVTNPGSHLTKAQHVNATWARRCTRVLFVTNAEPLPSEYDYVNKTCQILSAAKEKGNDLQQFGDKYCDGHIAKKINESSTNRTAGTVNTNTSGSTMPDITKNEEWRSWFDVKLPFIEVKESHASKDGLWNKTKEGFFRAHRFFLNDYDWFMKADDDTYVIMENLRNLLQFHEPEEPIYFGCHFKETLNAGYMSGGGGYILSRAAVRRFVDVLMYEDMTLSTDSEDVAMGEVMKEGGVKVGDSRDALGRARFFPLAAAAMAYPDKDAKPDWYWSLTGQTPDPGPNSCSPTAISFHYMTPGDMYTMELMLYHIKLHGMAR